jgi:hypothetical protein
VNVGVFHILSGDQNDLGQDRAFDLRDDSIVIGPGPHRRVVVKATILLGEKFEDHPVIQICFAPIGYGQPRIARFRKV